MKPKVKMQRIYQQNGPDYWTASCYVQDYNIRVYSLTQQIALNKALHKIDRLLYKDWYEAHQLNEWFDLVKRQQKLGEKEREEAARKSYSDVYTYKRRTWWEFWK